MHAPPLALVADNVSTTSPSPPYTISLYKIEYHPQPTLLFSKAQILALVADRISTTSPFPPMHNFLVSNITSLIHNAPCLATPHLLRLLPIICRQHRRPPRAQMCDVRVRGHPHPTVVVMKQRARGLRKATPAAHISTPPTAGLAPATQRRISSRGGSCLHPLDSKHSPRSFASFSQS